MKFLVQFANLYHTKKNVFLSTNCNSALSFEWNYLRWRTKLSQICFRMTLGQKIWCVFVLNVLLKFPCVIASENMANAVYSTIQPEQPPPLKSKILLNQRGGAVLDEHFWSWLTHEKFKGGTLVFLLSKIWGPYFNENGGLFRTPRVEKIRFVAYSGGGGAVPVE